MPSPWHDVHACVSCTVCVIDGGWVVSLWQTTQVDCDRPMWLAGSGASLPEPWQEVQLPKPSRLWPIFGTGVVSV